MALFTCTVNKLEIIANSVIIWQIYIEYKLMFLVAVSNLFSIFKQYKKAKIANFVHFKKNLWNQSGFSCN